MGKINFCTMMSMQSTSSNDHIDNGDHINARPERIESHSRRVKTEKSTSTARTASMTTTSESSSSIITSEFSSDDDGPFRKQQQQHQRTKPASDSDCKIPGEEEDRVAVSSLLREEPEFIEKKLGQMEEEIQKLRSNRSAYDRARFLSPARIRSNAFRLMFLRAEQYDTRKAARRIVAFFEAKRKLHGDEKLTKAITLDDLDLDDQEALLSEAFQVLPCTDTSGRVVIFIAAPFLMFKSWENQLRAAWYVLMSTIENDERAQRKGIVIVVYNVESESRRSMMGCRQKGGLLTHLNIMEGYQLRDALPLRISYVHYCHHGVERHPIASVLKQFIGKDAHHRFVEHDGPHLECQFALGSSGIAPGILPINKTGNLTLEDFARWLTHRKEVEALRKEEEQKSDRIYVARNSDVLAGRGRPFQDHPGNARLAKLIDKYRDEYNSVERFRKTCISWEIVNQIRDNAGRFLQKDESTDTWVAVNDIDCREKVARGFRRKGRGGVAGDV